MRAIWCKKSITGALYVRQASSASGDSSSSIPRLLTASSTYVAAINKSLVCRLFNFLSLKTGQILKKNSFKIYNKKQKSFINFSSYEFNL